jgi:folate-binding protein YgfZ
VSTPLPVHEALGVRWSDTLGATSLPRSYGDAPAEYLAATTTAAVVDRADRALVRVYGRDPLRILQGVLTNDVTLASPERAVYAALLTPRGRMIADLRVLRAGDDFLLELDAAALPALLDSFRRTVPPLFARFEDVSESWHVVGVYGPGAAVRLGALLGAPLPPADFEDVATTVSAAGEPALAVSTRLTGGPGYDVVASPAAATTLWHDLLAAGVRPMGHAPLDVLRIEAGVPRWGAELTPVTIPLEAGLQERAISTGKGCYTGQEVIIRILHRGHVNWLLRGLLLGQAAGAGRDTPLFDAGGKQVGRITSSAWSPRLDQEIALGYVRRELEPGGMLRLATPDGPQAQVVTLPFAS